MHRPGDGRPWLFQLPKLKSLAIEVDILNGQKYTGFGGY
jgi:hypothetical protein